MRRALERRATHRGLHGHAHVSRQRRTALLMIWTALGRVAIWALLLILYLAGVAFAIRLFASVKFISVLSVIALLLTDWGQLAASLAQLTAGDAHHDAEAVRAEQAVDYASLETDIGRLALLEPCPEADRLAAQIRSKLKPEHEETT